MGEMQNNNVYYEGYPEIPYINPNRQLAMEVPRKLVSKYNMTRLESGLLPGDIILLWRVAFGTFTTTVPYSKYFEYTYGIDGPKNMAKLVEDGYVVVETAFDSLDHLNAAQVKSLLQQKSIKGLSKCTREQLDHLLSEHYTEEELAKYVTVRGYVLTEKGKLALAQGQEVVDKHPKKKY